MCLINKKKVLGITLILLAVNLTAYAVESPVKPIQPDQVTQVVSESRGVMQELYGQLMGLIIEHMKYFILTLIGLLITIILPIFRFARIYAVRFLFLLIMGLIIIILAPIITSKLLNF